MRSSHAHAARTKCHACSAGCTVVSDPQQSGRCENVNVSDRKHTVSDRKQGASSSCRTGGRTKHTVAGTERSAIETKPAASKRKPIVSFTNHAVSSSTHRDSGTKPGASESKPSSSARKHGVDDREHEVRLALDARAAAVRAPSRIRSRDRCMQTLATDLSSFRQRRLNLARCARRRSAKRTCPATGLAGGIQQYSA